MPKKKKNTAPKHTAKKKADVQENKENKKKNSSLTSEEKKRRTVLSIISYAIVVCAILLIVLFIANFAGSTAWFTWFCKFLFGFFSWAALLVPVLMIYGAWFLPKIVTKKAHIWNLILAAWLGVNVAVLIGVAKYTADAAMDPVSVYNAGVAHTGAGVIGTYIGWLLVKALSRAGAYVLTIALMIAQVVFLIGLTLDDFWAFVKECAKRFWHWFKGLFKKEKKEPASPEKTKESDPADGDEDEDDEEFIPPEKPAPGTKYFHKPKTEDEPTVETKGHIDENPYADDDGKIADIPTPTVIPRPGTPDGWGAQGGAGKSGKGETDEHLPKIKRTDKPEKGVVANGSVDLEGIFHGDASADASPFVAEIDDGDDTNGIAAKRVPLISTTEPGKDPETRSYTFPPISLLTSMPPLHTDATEEQTAKARKLVETLRSFKVNTRVVNISRGPTITRYELQPEEGVRVRQIVNLVDDISLSLASSGVRIEAPIPGKAAVGVEVPNQTRETVYLRTLLENGKFELSSAKLTAAVGEDVAGDPIYVDLAKMPHLLIAGTTGSGKSVCMNCLILSVLYKATPDEVKMIMIDPKKVEFNVYNGLPHLIIPVVSNAKKAAGALSWAVSEMERRYELIESVGVRDIKNYNRITENDPEKEFMPQLLIIIDELADLMMTAPGEVEESICRIAQKGRAAGMHLIIGTQRPSVDVITGLIKANIPSRIAFTVSSQVDSRTIIDIAGAEKLIGRGDMLFAPIGSIKPARLQGAFVSDEEVEAVTNYIIENSAEAVYDDDVIKDIEKQAELCGSKGKKASGAEGMDLGGEDGDTDPMLKPAIDLAVESGKISTSLIQRRLNLGYGRAAKLIDIMQDRGIVSPPEGQKPRTVLISAAEWNEICMRAEDGV